TKNIVLHLDLDEQMNQMKMDMDRRKNFYLIYKESVNNIVKYADCNNVWIILKRQWGDVILDIRDDGKGFDSKEHFRGNGLVNMKRRADALGGELQILSEPGKGTNVVLKFKL